MRHDKEREGDVWSHVGQNSNIMSWVASGANSQRSETVWQVQEVCVCLCMCVCACIQVHVLALWRTEKTISVFGLMCS